MKRDHNINGKTRSLFGWTMVEKEEINEGKTERRESDKKNFLKNTSPLDSPLHFLFNARNFIFLGLNKSKEYLERPGEYRHQTLAISDQVLKEII